jgi:serine protease AprX
VTGSAGRAVSVTALVALLALVAALAALAAETATARKVDPRVLEDTADGRVGHFIVVLRTQADVDGAVAGARDQAGQGRSAFGALRRAASAQSEALAELRRTNARVRPFWIVDAIAVEGTRAAVNAMADRPDVASIEPDRAFLALPVEQSQGASSAPAGIEWNVEKVGAPAVWRLGDHGENVVYGNIDSGVEWNHPALRGQYRGWNGTAATHDYNWWDAVHADVDGDGTNPCGFDLRAPCDDAKLRFNSHGTHTMGTAVGDDGAGNQVGIAPRAKWIACRPMDVGLGRPSTYLECLQFFLAPTNLSGGSPDPARRPDVVGNSWGCPPEEGCSADVLRSAIDNLRAAGVFMAVAAGNEGRDGCSSVATPPATYDSAISVGAVDFADRVADFSSRGPVAVDGSGRRKPDLVAPGVSIRSSTANGYGTSTGTSMAAPHLGGVAALLWSAFPELRRNVDRTEQLLEQTAVRLPAVSTCGGDGSSQLPNNLWGHGRIDVHAAYRAAEAEFPPSLSVADLTVREGARATLTVKLSRGSTQPVTVAYATADRTAKANSDYRAATGRITLASGETSKRVTIATTGDSRREPGESFAVTLSDPSHATLGRGQATVTIRDEADGTKPVLRRLAVAGGSSPTVRFTLSEPATTSFTLDRGGRRVAGFSAPGKSGANSFRLASRVSRGALTPGSYRLTAVPRDRAGNVGRPARTAFSVRS